MLYENWKNSFIFLFFENKSISIYPTLPYIDCMYEWIGGELQPAWATVGHARMHSSSKLLVLRAQAKRMQNMSLAGGFIVNPQKHARRAFRALANNRRNRSIGDNSELQVVSDLVCDFIWNQRGSAVRLVTSFDSRRFRYLCMCMQVKCKI